MIGYCPSMPHDRLRHLHLFDRGFADDLFAVEFTFARDEAVPIGPYP